MAVTSKVFYLSNFFITIGFLLGISTLLYPNICSTDKVYFDQIRLTPQEERPIDEEYDSEIAAISSLEDMKRSIKKKVEDEKLSGIEIPILIDNFVRNKFFHRASYLTSCKYWLLDLLNITFPEFFFDTAMRPEDIIKKDYGICNQQAIVFQDIVQDFGFEYGSVRFATPNFGHFASAVKVDNSWFFFDSNLEPPYDRRNPNIFKSIIAVDKTVLNKMYEHRIKGTNLSFDQAKKGMITLSDINTFPAQRGVLVQDLSYLFSNFGWLLFLFIGILLRRTYKK